MRGTTTIGQAPIIRRAAMLAAMTAIAFAVAVAVVQLLLRWSGRAIGAVDAAVATACLIVAVVVATVLLGALIVAGADHRPPAEVASRGTLRLTSGRRAAANAAVWAAIAALAVGAAGDAFTPLPGGAVVAAALIAGALAAVTGAVHRRAHRQSAYRSFNVVAMLLAAGCLASMSLTSTGDWWSLNFSTLGTSNDIAAACFNLALILSGGAMAAMSGRLASGIARRAYDARRGAVPTVRALIAVIGVSLAGVGVVPIDTDEVLHNVFACGAGAAFALLASLTPVLVRRMPRVLVRTSRASLALEVSAFVIYERLGLVSLTVFEIVAFALVFVWLITLVVTTHPVVIHELAELEPLVDEPAGDPMRGAVDGTAVLEPAGAPRGPARRAASVISPPGMAEAFARLTPIRT